MNCLIENEIKRILKEKNGKKREKKLAYFIAGGFYYIVNRELAHFIAGGFINAMWTLIGF